MRRAHRQMRSAAKGAANLLGLRTPSRYRNERTRTNRGGGAAASAEQALAAEQAIERRRAAAAFWPSLVRFRAPPTIPFDAEIRYGAARLVLPIQGGSSGFCSRGRSQRAPSISAAPADKVALGRPRRNDGDAEGRPGGLALPQRAHAHEGSAPRRAGPTARLRRRSEPSLKPSPRVKLAEPSSVIDDDKKSREDGGA